MPRFPPGGEEHRRGRATLAARAACTGDGHGSISAAALCGTLGLHFLVILVMITRYIIVIILHLPDDHGNI